jgi:glycosyltransferase involved in cell wall biosynthesis
VLPGVGEHEYLLFLPTATRAELADLPGNFRPAHVPWAERSYAARFFWEQFFLPREVQQWRGEVLVCLGNFCPLWCPAPVLLLSRNALYFTPRYLRDLRERGHRLWALRHVLMSRLALASARAARLTVTPTAAMADMIRAAGGTHPPRLATIPHGFEPWPVSNGRPRTPGPPPFRFLILSHYNYYRNFETVFRALALLQKEGRSVQLVLSTRLEPGLKLGGYDTTRAYRLLDQLGIRHLVTTRGAVAYDDLPDIYGAAHAVVCASYSESFGMTVVEAMASGVPVIASDIPAHREVARDTALFFPSGDATALAARCRELMDNEDLRARRSAAGLERARNFSWRRHFEALLAAAEVVTA